MMNLVRRQRCPKCGGNLYIDTDYYGTVEKCLQCGYTHDVEVIHPKKQEENCEEHT